MPEDARPALYSIAAHRGFADALVAGLIPRYRDRDLGLARLTLLLPSRRTVRTVTEAFVRALDGEGGGMLLPRMAVVGDLDLDETLGPLLDPLGAGAAIPPAADPVRRWLRLAEILDTVDGGAAVPMPARLRQAYDLGTTMDRLLVEGIGPDDLLSERIMGIVGDLAEHWKAGTRTFLTVQAHWLAELAARGEVDAPTRRNLLFDHAARRWCEEPPIDPVVAAGVTSASPALARLLRTLCELPNGAVILPDLDLDLEKETWQGLGRAGIAPQPDEAPFGAHDAVTHPQYHLKLLLNRMGVSRAEVRPWHRSGPGAARPERSKAISNLFLPPGASARWVTLDAGQRRLTGVRLMRSAHPEEEAQAIAILIREALETPERRVALVTPDQGLAARVSAHLNRWGIDADDSAGQPLPLTTAGRLFLLLAQVLEENAAPVPLVALLSHPLVRRGAGRAAWLEAVRRFDRRLRGPRLEPGLAALRVVAEAAKVGPWWAEVEAVLSPLLDAPDRLALDDALDRLVRAAESLCGDGLWGEADGRALSSFVDGLRDASQGSGLRVAPRDLHAVLRDAMARSSARPPWGGHPRVAIYGLLEARMSRADLIICGGLVEGVWPGRAAPDSLLPAPVLRGLGVPGADFRIGLAAHDLAAAMGAPEVVLSHALRDEGAPVIPSRFVLRVEAMLGRALTAQHRETEAVRLARQIDDVPRAASYPRPEPCPDAAQRKVALSATGLDRLRSDPYQFYAGTILGLGSLDALDDEPSAAWKGSAVHEILEAWHQRGEPAGALRAIAERHLDALSAHPLMRSLWRPRLMAALDWIDEQVSCAKAEGRRTLLSEKKGTIDWRGVEISARADRIDTLPGGGLAIVDYKTGTPPSATMVENGFSLQLGLTGLIASEGGFDGVAGTPTRFEYWSLAKQKRGDGFGYVEEPVRDPESKRRTGPLRDEFLEETQRYLDEALDDWILGSRPFTARLNPDLPSYADYDQLMRLDEWLIGLADVRQDAS